MNASHVVGDGHNPDRLISIAEAMTILPVGRTKLSELLLRGDIESAKIGDGRRFVRLASLREYVARALAQTAAQIERPR